MPSLLASRGGRRKVHQLWYGSQERIWTMWFHVILESWSSSDTFDSWKDRIEAKKYYRNDVKRKWKVRISSNDRCHSAVRNCGSHQIVQENSGICSRYATLYRRYFWVCLPSKVHLAETYFVHSYLKLCFKFRVVGSGPAASRGEGRSITGPSRRGTLANRFLQSHRRSQNP